MRDGEDDRIKRLGCKDFPESKAVCSTRKALSLAGAGTYAAGMRTILLIVLILLLIGSLPTWGYSSGWGTGYFPAGALLVVIILVLLLTGRGRV